MKADKHITRFQFYFARAMQMGNEGWLWTKIEAWLKDCCDVSEDEIAQIKDLLNKEARLHN